MIDGYEPDDHYHSNPEIPDDPNDEPDYNLVNDDCTDGGYTVDDGDTDGAVTDPAPADQQSSLDTADWHILEVEPRYLNNEDIAPFTIVSGLKNLKDFGAMEQTIVGALTSTLHDHRPAISQPLTSEEAMASNPNIARDRILNHLRPAGFIGTLLEGQVQILPFDPERAMAHSPRLRVPMRAQLEKDPTPFVGVGAIFTGLLRSSTGRLGQLNVEATYYLRRISHNTSGNADHGRIGRTIGSTEMIGTMEDELAQRIEASKDRALALARYAVGYTYSGGLPGHSRRYGDGRK